MNIFRRSFMTLTALSAITIAVFTTGNVVATEPLSTLHHYQNLTITIRGNPDGLELVFIPGLSSHWSTFEDICEQFSSQHRCHLVQLPGFAGYSPISDFDPGFIIPVKKQLAGYLDEYTEGRTLLVGHSLGGMLAMMVASMQDEDVIGLVLVDSLPFFPAAQNPAATVELILPLATQIRRNILGQSREMFEARVSLNTAGLSNNPARTKTLIEWGRTSDQATMAHAMYDLQTTDMRPAMADIKVRTLILGAWAAYADFGSTKEAVSNVFESSYRNLEHREIDISETGYHFLMWDDKNWMVNHMHVFMEKL